MTPGSRTQDISVRAAKARARIRLLPVVMLTAFGVYTFVYPFGILLLAAGWLPEGAGWVGGVLLEAQGVALAAWLGINWGARRGLAAATLLGAGGWLIEALGVTTGLPFGAYRYTGGLGPWLGPVPAAIPFAWIAGVGAAVWTGQRLLPRGISGLWATAFLGAGLATLQDVVLEPAATRVQGYWQWLDPAGVSFHGVPLANFVGWFGAALLLGATMLLLLRPEPARLRYGWLPALLYCMNLVMFGVLDMSSGAAASAALVALLLVGLWWRLH